MRTILHPLFLEAYLEIVVWSHLHQHKAHPHYYYIELLLISECHKANLVPEKLIVTCSKSNIEQLITLEHACV